MRIPALLPTLALLSGVASQPVQTLDPAPMLCAGALAALLSLAARGRHDIRVIALCLACGCAGAALAENDHRRHLSSLDALFQHSDIYLGTIEGRVSDRLLTDANGSRWLLLEGNRPGADGAAISFRMRVDGSIAPHPILPGDAVRVWCRIRRPSLATRRFPLRGTVKSPALIELVPGTRPGADAWRWRPWAERRLDARRPSDPEARSLVQAMIFGRSHALGAATRRALRDAGVLHLTAVSGLHVGLVLGSLLYFLSRIGLRPPLVALLLIPVALLFAAGLGGRPSIARAASAAAVMSAGRALGREGTAINALALVAGILVAFEPSVLWDVGFQLSFSAVAGIVGLSAPIGRQLMLPRPLASAAAVSIAAYVATLPLVALHFSRVSPASLVSNLVATPLAAVVLGGGYGAVLLAGVDGLSAPLASAADMAARVLIDLSECVAAHPGSAWSVVAPTFWHMPIWGLALIGSGVGHTGLRRTCRIALTTLVLMVHLGPPPRAPGRATVTLIDVGQGSSTLLQSAEGRRLLIDAGGRGRGGFDPGERQVLPHLVAAGGLQLDVLAISHGDADHASGAFALLRELDVDALWIPTGAHRHSRIVALQSAAVEAGVAVRLIQFGERSSLGSMPIRIVGPGRDPLPEFNDQSLTIHAGDAPTRVLIPGDLEQAGERALLESGAELRSSLLVLAHHGSRHGTADALLERVRPSMAAVSAGRGNPFGHPHPETLRRLTRRRIPLHRTDLDGSLTFRVERGRWRRDYSAK